MNGRPFFNEIKLLINDVKKILTYFFLNYRKQQVFYFLPEKYDISLSLDNIYFQTTSCIIHFLRLETNMRNIAYFLFGE